jgi:guanylate kinase
MIAEDNFLEYAKYNQTYYGTPRKPVEENLAAGKDVILEIETQGAFQVKELRPDAYSLFILPPSVNELDRRLHKRATEKEETIRKRVSQAAGEIAKADKYDYVIMNDDLDAAIEDFKAVIDGIRGVKDPAVRFSPENEEIKNMIREVLENA